MRRTGAGQLHVVFLSPSGLRLGYIRVPVEAFFEEGEYRRRTPEDVTRWWQCL